MSPSLSGARALVTGGSRGIGKAITSMLYDEGARVYILGRDRGRLQSAAEEIVTGAASRSAAGAEVTRHSPIPLPTDLGDPKEIERLVAEFPEAGLDILVNNAGVARNIPLRETSDEEWEFHFRINVDAPFRLLRGFLPRLRLGTNPCVVNIGSVVSRKGYVNQGAYTASKHALLGLTKVFAREVHGEGIRVFSVEPGGVNTEMIHTMRPDIDESALTQPAEVAETVRHLILMTGGAMIDHVQIRRSAKEPWQ
ncbi:MAG: SDR family NAD(P)-dependent oxidoreductase [Spirochaetaceae bacterium]